MPTKRKFIITIDDSISDEDAIELLGVVIRAGKISAGHKQAPKYSHVTLWDAADGSRVIVYCPVQYGTDTAKFSVYRDVEPLTLLEI